jgi:hypothetical protein
MTELGTSRRRTTVRLTLVVLILLAAAPVAAQNEFKNPDGRPGTFALEPTFSYFSNMDWKVEALGESESLEGASLSTINTGLNLLIPAGERVTLRAALTYIRQTPRQPVLGVDTKTTISGAQYAAALRIWLGTPGNVGPEDEQRR